MMMMTAIILGSVGVLRSGSRGVKTKRTQKPRSHVAPGVPAAVPVMHAGPPCLEESREHGASAFSAQQLGRRGGCV